MVVRFESRRAVRASASAEEEVGTLGTTSGRQAAWAANTPWYRTWFTRGGGTIAASFSASSTGESSIEIGRAHV